ncbi:MAG: penicillin-binding protein [Candidatus Neomarinimicrobiota bacterium]
MTKVFLKYRARITVLSSLVLLGWVILAARLFQIQLIEGDGYRLQGQRQAQVKVGLPPDRGTIYDRKTVALTSNIHHYSIGVHPSQVQSAQTLAEAVSAITGKDAQSYQRRITSAKSFIYLERNLADPRCEALLENRPAGLAIEKRVSRSYPHQNIAAQLLGFVNVDGTGIAGLELKLDSQLRGQAGWMVKQADGLGKTQPKVSYPYKEPLDGCDVYLTIDLEYQALLQDELSRRLRETDARSASGILMNPQDGSILALASVPDFDPAAPGNAPAENQKNRVISDQFEPGSTYKIVCATAALDQDIVAIDQEFNCEGGKYSLPGKTITDWESFGLLNFSQIIEQSSNVGVIKIAQLVGPKNLYRYSRNFGFGSQTNVNLISETSGTLRHTADWSEISLAELSIGYEVGVTALQLATAYCAVANGGILMKPRIIDRIVAGDQTVIYSDRPEVVRKVASPEVMQTLTGMLTRAVAHGTGSNAKIPGWSVAGKTGTAQKYVDGSYSQSKYISNFAGFFPVENPQLVGVIVLDEPRIGYHWGSIGAAPVFKRVVERIINLDDDLLLAAAAEQPAFVQAVPLEEPTPAPVYIPLSTRAVVTKTKAEPGKCIIPDIRGMSLKKALQTLHQAGLKPQFQGSGTVTWQSPRPGLSVPENTTCRIGLQ